MQCTIIYIRGATALYLDIIPHTLRCICPGAAETLEIAPELKGKRSPQRVRLSGYHGTAHLNLDAGTNIAETPYRSMGSENCCLGGFSGPFYRSGSGNALLH